MSLRVRMHEMNSVVATATTILPISDIVILSSSSGGGGAEMSLVG